MGASVDLVVVDPTVGAVVYEGWVGGHGAWESARAVLARPRDQARPGLEAWGRIDAVTASRVCEAHYADGLPPAAVAALAAMFPPDRFWWSIVVDL